MKKFFTWLFNNLKFKDYLLIGLLMLTCLFYIRSNYYYNKSLTPTIVYNTDSLSTYKNKLNEEYAMNLAYVQTIKQLKEGNDELSLELQKLKDNPVVITKEKIKFKVDTIYTVSDNIEKTDSTHILNWHYNDNEYYSLNGTTSVKNDFTSFNTRINNLLVNTDLSINIIEKDNKLQVIGNSTNPYVHINNMSGVVIDPTESKVLKKLYKQKKWGIGPAVNLGITSDGKLKPSIGISAQYSLIQF